MPFDGSGNFSRVHDWTDDAANGIKILASRMDEEFDNFAAGMNVVFFRSGLVPMSGNLNMGQNYLIGLGAGSNAAPGVRFADDPISGLYLDGLYKPSLASQGVKRFGVNTSGAEVIGALTVSGAATLSSTLGVTGAATFTGDVIANAGTLRINSAASVPALYMTQNGAGYSRVRYAYTGQSGAFFALRDDTAAVDRFTIDNTGIATFSGAVIASGGIVFGRNSGSDEKFRASGASPFYSAYNAAETTRLGYLQFQAGNAALSSDAGTITLVAGGVTGFTLNSSRDISSVRNIVTSGTVFFSDGNFAAGLASGNSRITFDTSNDYLEFNRTSNVYSHVIGGITRLTVNGSGASVAGTFDSSGTLSQAGSAVWHAGNFDPTLKANLAGPTFTGVPAAPTAAGGTNTTQIATTAFVQSAIGALNIGSYAPLAGANFTGAVTVGDANHGLSIVTSNPRHTWDTNDYDMYDRVNNKRYWYVGGTAVMSLDSTGTLRLLGNIIANAGTL